jgi:hypothetical protein
MDDTLAPIILPMLKQLKETKHGAPAVSFKDVPQELLPPDAEAFSKLYAQNGETDENFFKRWDWVLDEMIWAFEQKCRDDWMDDYYGPHIPNDGGIGNFEWIDRDGLEKHQKRMSNGFRLFGKYYENMWD